MGPTIIHAPTRTMLQMKVLFLAGTIDMGKSIDWQKKVIDDIVASNMGYVTICNPRRPDWDPSWTQSITNPQFTEQVIWEQYHLDVATHVLVHIEPTSQSVITLLELGQLSKMTGKKIVVSCGEGYFRRGNVEIVCLMHNMCLVNNLEEGIAYMKVMLTTK